MNSGSKFKIYKTNKVHKAKLVSDYIIIFIDTHS